VKYDWGELSIVYDTRTSCQYAHGQNAPSPADRPVPSRVKENSPGSVWILPGVGDIVAACQPIDRVASRAVCLLTRTVRASAVQFVVVA
jgi:hypothetical protein